MSAFEGTEAGLRAQVPEFEVAGAGGGEHAVVGGEAEGADVGAVAGELDAEGAGVVCGAGFFAGGGFGGVLVGGEGVEFELVVCCGDEELEGLFGAGGGGCGPGCGADFAACADDEVGNEGVGDVGSERCVFGVGG